MHISLLAFKEYRAQSLLKWKTLYPSSTMAPTSNAHRGTHTELTNTSISFSSFAHSVRQNASLSSMATRYHARFFKFSAPLRGSKPGLHRPAILTMSMRRRMTSKVQTGRKIRNQLQWIFSSSLRTSIMRKISVKIHVRRTLWARDMFIGNAGLRAQHSNDLRTGRHRTGKD